MLLKIKIWLYIWVVKNLYGYTKVSTKTLYAQAWHETGDFKSQVFKENKNLFGMRHPSKRKTFSQGSNLGHAVFKNHLSSVRDYFERQKEFNIPNSEDSGYMLKTVNSNYAEDPNYLTKWQNVKDIIKQPISNTFLLVLFFLLLGTIFLIYKNKSKQ